MKISRHKTFGKFKLCIYYSGKEPACQCQCRRCKRHRFHPWVGKIPWRRKWQHTPVFLPWKSHGQRNLAGYSPWDGKETQLKLLSTKPLPVESPSPQPIPPFKETTEHQLGSLCYRAASHHLSILHLTVHKSMLLSQSVLASPSPTVSTSPFSTSASPCLLK